MQFSPQSKNYNNTISIFSKLLNTSKIEALCLLTFLVEDVRATPVFMGGARICNISIIMVKNE